jgi:hypothetical protein
MISGKQVSMALSTTKMKYITTSFASHKTVWLQKLLVGLHSRHDIEGRSESLVFRDEFGMMQNISFTERECCCFEQHWVDILLRWPCDLAKENGPGIVFILSHVT